MEDFQKRRKKKDKAKEKLALTGGLSKKHIRIAEKNKTKN
jgi:DNA-binding XRE family transcriptional regulator